MESKAVCPKCKRLLIPDDCYASGDTAMYCTGADGRGCYEHRLAQADEENDRLREEVDRLDDEVAEAFADQGDTQ